MNVFAASFLGARRSNLVCAVLLACLFTDAGWAQANTNAESASADSSSNDAALNDEMDASGTDGDVPRRQLVKWNEYEGPYITLRVGAGFLYDYVGYDQDEDSKEQMSLSQTGMVRDARLLFKGRFPTLPRLSYTLGYMYDVAKEDWRFRQTGLMVDIPELHGQFFLGRTKEGMSTNKLMVGYQGWTNERASVNDAFHPILADGVKWMGRIPNGELVYSLGVFNDTLSENESFNKFDNQFVGRAIWLPFVNSDPKRVLHLGVAYRYGESDDGAFQFRSKPESYPAQSYAIDTGKFAAQHSDTIGVEAYYRPGPLMFGSEYFVNKVSSREFNDPSFHGGEVFVAWLVTGETRPYNTRGANFERVSPKRTVFSGGPGAWEVVARFSYSDLDSGPINGGKFWRFTPMVNWHMSDNVRLELVYGYGVLDRFGIQGGSHYYQSRIQFQL
jgi:phosphate-selective porin OprO/OprP